MKEHYIRQKKDVVKCPISGCFLGSSDDFNRVPEVAKLSQSIALALPAHHPFLTHIWCQCWLVGSQQIPPVLSQKRLDGSGVDLGGALSIPFHKG